MRQRVILSAVVVAGVLVLSLPVLWATLLSPVARLRRRWKSYLRRRPNVPESGHWVREGYVGFEDGSKAGGWGGCEGGYHPFPCPLTLGPAALHVHPWPYAHIPQEKRLGRLPALSVPWPEVQSGGDRFTWILCEDPRLVLHLTSEGAKALEAFQRGEERA